MGWVLNATPEVEAISQWETIIAIACVLSVLSVAVVCSRLWIRHTARGLAADDWMSALSMAFALIYSGLTIARELFGHLHIRIASNPPLLSPFPQHHQRSL